MKRTYSSTRNALFSSLPRVSLGVGALLFSLLVLAFRFVAPDAFFRVAAPAFSVSDTFAAAVHGALGGFGDTAALAARVEALTAENAALANANRALTTRLAAIAPLAASSAGGPSVIAGVVSRPPESPYDSLIVAAGAADGVAAGQEAFAGDGTPVGVVSSVSGGFARVTLFSAPGVTTRGWIGDAALAVTLTGAGAGALTTTVARSADVSPGAVVYVPGPGLVPLGRVTAIDDDPASTGVVLHIASVENLFSLGWVALRDTGIGATASSTP